MKAGFVGLGAMGVSMARNIAKAGHLNSVWNRTRERAEQLALELNLSCAANPIELAKHSDVILMCVSADTDVLDLVNAVIPGLSSGKIVVDMSTVSSETAREAANLLAAYGTDFLDAPVSGGVEGARNGTLAMMVGGDAIVLDRVRPILDAMSHKIVHMGGVGSGQGTKAVNQVMAAGINQAVTEALAFGQAQGLPMDQLIDAIAGGAAGNWFLNHRGSSMTQGRYTPGFKLRLHHKDLVICQNMAKRLGFDLPLTDQTIEHYQELMRQDFGDEDISALYRLKN